MFTHWKIFTWNHISLWLTHPKFLYGKFINKKHLIFLTLIFLCMRKCVFFRPKREKKKLLSPFPEANPCFVLGQTPITFHQKFLIVILGWCKSFASSAIFTWPLAHHFFKHPDNVLWGKGFNNQQEAENAFQEFNQILKHRFLKKYSFIFKFYFLIEG